MAPHRVAAAEDQPAHYWLSTVPKDVDLAELIALAKLRWRIERDYQEFKDGLDLDHYEGRSWRGFTIMASYAWPLIASWRRSGAAFPPSSYCPPQARSGPKFRPAGFSPRGRNDIIPDRSPRSASGSRAS
jgi:hypothetical protein